MITWICSSELQSLEHRRLLFDLVFCYKNVFGIVVLDIVDYLKFDMANKF